MNDKILPILRKIRSDGNFLESQDYVADGILDSYDIVTLVSALEKELNIAIDGGEVTPDNFRNLDTLTTFVRRQLERDEDQTDR